MPGWSAVPGPATSMFAVPSPVSPTVLLSWLIGGGRSGSGILLAEAEKGWGRAEVAVVAEG